MKKISAPYMASIKGLPYLVVFMVAVMLVLMLANGVYGTKPSLLLLPCGMAVVGYFIAKSNARGLADEVYDCGDSLLIRKSGEEERISLASIVNVNFNAQPSRITLTVDAPGRFGDRILFAPPPQVHYGQNPENEVAQDLVVRTSQARMAKLHR